MGAFPPPEIAGPVVDPGADPEVSVPADGVDGRSDVSDDAARASAWPTSGGV
jgi:hypothetical protein